MRFTGMPIKLNEYLAVQDLDMAQEIENILFSKFVNNPIPFELITIPELYERCKQSNYDLSIPHRIEFHALLIITEGYTEHFLDFKSIVLVPGVILPLSKNQVHAFSESCKVKGFVVSFDESFITQSSSEKNLFHFLHLFNTPNIQIDINAIHCLNPYINILKTELQNENHKLKSELVNSALITLLLKIQSLLDEDYKVINTKRYRDFITFKNLIENHYTESHNAKDYAEKLSVSYKYLNDICKSMVNATAKVLIDDWLLLEIKRNLLEKKYTSQEIAFKMGFKEHSNFIRFFKKFTGVTPSVFQNQI